MTLRTFYKRYSLGAGVLYGIAVALFLLFRNYSNFWILFVGNMVFGAVVYAGIIAANNRIHDTASINSLFMTGVKLSFYGLVIAVVLTLLMMGLNAVLANFSAQDSPSQSGSDTQTDVLLTLLAHTLAGNAFMGVLASVLVSATIKRNQKTEQGKTIY